LGNVWLVEEYGRMEVENNQYNYNGETEIRRVIECRLDNGDEKENM